ncbi:PTS sugar transporter subunit IIB [Oceanobacillus oncorhynchi]|uniref:PTS sugar transporter subunit IIB n=1 Tax=Oceanobacillus oncorhynchi TaxID=545501 RepID=UPI0025A4209D|nr:PTS sugar transporter subunit IIB [Oceanobacillus oncorhynchi]MDM8101353.1 PTS sugar transporter subunit IIB [Oceanobacillus oncorhynchi]
MKILTVCGMGSGSSLILKMNVEEVLSGLGKDAEVDACDIGSVAGHQVDLLISTKEFGDQLEEFTADKILVSNVVDKSDIEQQLKDYLAK